MRGPQNGSSVLPFMPDTASPTSDTSSQDTPIQISPNAAREIRKIINKKNIPDGYGLRVGVKGGGCSGMSYVLGFDKEREKDKVFNLDGITVYMDKRHGLYLMGTTINYHDGLDARGFTFENPNATETCGCGASFAA
ncbi:iron-sulfur cluster assembly accessory protein, putative [Salinibacter ruber DSM 13855]|uniref:Iron-sulfur cluster assembly accessory protein, putative n=2 Tax=Salinibacter ruber TaxID=146919 RepID=Q2S2Y9_SALRD|nr:iron-sulfur cluster assembly accessory protein, putative [Salinibacter ruber DSM 13855]